MISLFLGILNIFSFTFCNESGYLFIKGTSRNGDIIDLNYIYYFLLLSIFIKAIVYIIDDYSVNNKNKKKILLIKVIKSSILLFNVTFMLGLNFLFIKMYLFECNYKFNLEGSISLGLISKITIFKIFSESEKLSFINECLVNFNDRLKMIEGVNFKQINLTREEVIRLLKHEDLLSIKKDITSILELKEQELYNSVEKKGFYSNVYDLLTSNTMLYIYLFAGAALIGFCVLNYGINNKIDNINENVIKNSSDLTSMRNEESVMIKVIDTFKQNIDIKDSTMLKFLDTLDDNAHSEIITEVNELLRIRKILRLTPDQSFIRVF